jgi:hypothetical protein
VRGRPNPPRFCRTCGGRLRGHAKHWHRRCVPAEHLRDRAKNFHRAVLKRRLIRFGLEIRRITGPRGRISREDLLTFGQRAYEMGYAAGVERMRKQLRRAA